MFSISGRPRVGGEVEEGRSRSGLGPAGASRTEAIARKQDRPSGITHLASDGVSGLAPFSLKMKNNH